MKVLQAQKGLLVINVFLVYLFLLNSCASNKLLQENESLNVVRSSLRHVSKEYLLRRAKKNYDSIVLFKDVFKFNKKDFEERIVFFKKGNEVSINKNKCADAIFDQFDFNDTVNNSELIEFWDIKKINISKVINKPKLQLSFTDTRIKLSAPIFNKAYTKALILVDYHNRGKIIFYLKKGNNAWRVDCELWMSQY